MNSPRLPLNANLTPSVPSGAAFKIIGLGGVGGIVARHLAIFLGSLRTSLRLVLCDGDCFEPHNASRMLFQGCGGNKAKIMREDLLAYFQDSELSIQAIGEYITPDNIERLILPGDIVILAVDNHATRKLLSDHCAKLPDVALFSGGNDGVEAGASGCRDRGTFGNVQIFLRQGGINLTPPLTENHPEIAHPKDGNPGVNCTEAIASTPQILFANLATASAILNALWLHLCHQSLHYGEAVFDIGEALMRPTVLLDARSPAIPME